MLVDVTKLLSTAFLKKSVQLSGKKNCRRATCVNIISALVWQLLDGIEVDAQWNGSSYKRSSSDDTSASLDEIDCSCNDGGAMAL